MKSTWSEFGGWRAGSDGGRSGRVLVWAGPALPAILAKCRQVYLAEVPKETILKMVPAIIKNMKTDICVECPNG